MSAYRRFIVPFFLLLPVVGLAYSWVTAERESNEGVIWDIPIAGYDPRDLLRGHYVQFRYDWPGLESEDGRGFYLYSGRVICIQGTAPEIETTRALDKFGGQFDTLAANCASIVEHNPWSQEGYDGLETDRIFLPQEKAREYQFKLADPQLQAFARVRVNNSNFLVPVDINFRPRAATEDEAEEGAENE